MIDALVWIALTGGIGTAVLAVCVFSVLSAGYIIPMDKYNSVELILAIVILVLLIIA